MNRSIAIGVGGIFHAERMADCLLRQGHDVHLYPTLPGFRLKLFAQERIHPHLTPEILLRGLRRVGAENYGDLLKMQLYGKLFAASVRRKKFDTIIGWSSFATEAFRQGKSVEKVLVRDSSHIRTQFEILTEEFQKFGMRFPDRRICLERELEEYERADRILVLSRFAERSFIEQGVDPRKIHLLPLGADTSLFKPDNNRATQLPLRVVYFGNLSLRKGVHYLLEAFQRVSPQLATLTLVGTVQPELRSLSSQIARHRHLPHQNHSALSEILRSQDIFLFPSIEDGFGTVVPQALACGLYTVLTQNCGAADLIEEGVNGSVIEARSSEAIVAAITRLANDCNWLTQRRRHIAEREKEWSWDRYAKRLEELFPSGMASARASNA